MKKLTKKHLVIFLIVAGLFSCGKSAFSGNILERKSKNKATTYYEANGKTYLETGFGKKVDIQPFISQKEDNATIVIRGEYQGWNNINISQMKISNENDLISLTCDKKYSYSFISQKETCDSDLKDKLELLKEILKSDIVKVVYIGAEKDSSPISFEISNEQKEVFSLIIEKYKSLEK